MDAISEARFESSPSRETYHVMLRAFMLLLIRGKFCMHVYSGDIKDEGIDD